MSASDHGFISLGKFSSARDSILSYLTSVGWANDSSGSVEAPTGWFAKISNDPADVHMPNTEITSILGDWFEENPEVVDSPELRKELEGHFMVRENEQGSVSVISYDKKWELDKDFEVLSAEYNEWDENVNGEPS
jgi:hypothetical protein